MRPRSRGLRAIGMGLLASFLLAASPLIGPQPVAQGPTAEAAFLRGMTLGLFSMEDPVAIARSVAELEELGVSAVSVLVPVATPDVRSLEFFDAPGVTPTDDAVRLAIRAARARDMQVMLFPILHVMEMGDGEWRGTLGPPDWEAWFRRYTDLILRYARMAEAEGVDLLSVGSELGSAEAREADWERLIARVRGVFRGKLVYSANWDHFRQVSFVEDLDYVGISAYYSLTDDPEPDPEQLCRAWDPIKADVLGWVHRHGRPLLFTEVGYPSRVGAGSDPWDHTVRRPASPEAQRRCYRAFMDAWSDVPQLAGVFFYLWWGDGGPEDRDYTPRGKPAAAELARWYDRIRSRAPASRP